MIPYNCTLLDALRYHRDLVTDDDIIEEVEYLNSIVDVVEDKIDFDSDSDSTAELSAVLDQKQEFIDRVEAACDWNCDIDEVVKMIKLNPAPDFFEKIKKAYEYRFGRIFGSNFDFMQEEIEKTIKEAPDSDTLVIQGVDFDLLEQQRQMLGQLNRSTLSAEELEALTGLLNMLDSWSDKR